MAGFVIALLIIVAIFGISSSMNSYATAQQAQAQIETAQAAQVASWGNLITILTIMLIVLFVVALLAACLWWWYRNLSRRLTTQPVGRTIAGGGQPQLSVNDLIQLELLKTLREMNGSSASHLLSEPDEETPVDDSFPWLR